MALKKEFQVTSVPQNSEVVWKTEVRVTHTKPNGEVDITVAAGEPLDWKGPIDSGLPTEVVTDSNQIETYCTWHYVKKEVYYQRRRKRWFRRKNTGSRYYRWETYWVKRLKKVPSSLYAGPVPFLPCWHVRKRCMGTEATVDIRSIKRSSWDASPGDHYDQEFTRQLSIYIPSELSSRRLGTTSDGLSCLIDRERFSAVRSKLQVRALRAMVPDIGRGFSLPRAVYELKDLNGMLTQVLNLVKHFPTKVRRAWNRPLKALSQGWLAAIFGWLPFVADVKKIVTQIFNADREIDRFLKDANKRQTLHYKSLLNPRFFLSEEHFQGCGVYDVVSDIQHDLVYAQAVFDRIQSPWYWTRRFGDGVMYHATLDFKYSVPILPAGLTSFLASLDYHGMRLSVGDVWDIIPFSFIIDWFVGVSRLLHQLDVDNLPVTVTPYDFCDSIRYHMSELRRATLPSMVVLDNEINEADEWEVHPLSASQSYTEDVYLRMVGLLPPPDPASIFRFPHGMRWVTMGALVVRR